MKPITPFYDFAEKLETYGNAFGLITENEKQWFLNLFPEVSQPYWYGDLTFTEARNILTMSFLLADVILQDSK